MSRSHSEKDRNAKEHPNESTTRNQDWLHLQRLLMSRINAQTARVHPSSDHIVRVLFICVCGLVCL